MTQTETHVYCQQVANGAAWLSGRWFDPHPPNAEKEFTY